MSEKIVTIISSADAAKARTGIMYTVNALKQGWLKDAKLFIFGPAEKTLLENGAMQKLLQDFQQLEKPAIVCKAVADQEGIAEEISALGFPVEYVGKLISDSIKDGYTPMVW